MPATLRTTQRDLVGAVLAIALFMAAVLIVLYGWRGLLSFMVAK